MSGGYAQVKDRLDEIARAVADEDLPLDDALALYEEAVRLGSQVSKLIETDIAAYDAAADAAAAADAPAADPAAAGAPPAQPSASAPTPGNR